MKEEREEDEGGGGGKKPKWSAQGRASSSSSSSSPGSRRRSSRRAVASPAGGTGPYSLSRYPGESDNNYNRRFYEALMASLSAEGIRGSSLADLERMHAIGGGYLNSRRGREGGGTGGASPLDLLYGDDGVGGDGGEGRAACGSCSPFSPYFACVGDGRDQEDEDSEEDGLEDNEDGSSSGRSEDEDDEYERSSRDSFKRASSSSSRRGGRTPRTSSSAYDREDTGLSSASRREGGEEDEDAEEDEEGSSREWLRRRASSASSVWSQRIDPAKKSACSGWGCGGGGGGEGEEEFVERREGDGSAGGAGGGWFSCMGSWGRRGREDEIRIRKRARRKASHQPRIKPTESWIPYLRYFCEPLAPPSADRDASLSKKKKQKEEKKNSSASQDAHSEGAGWTGKETTEAAGGGEGGERGPAAGDASGKRSIEKSRSSAASTSPSPHHPGRSSSSEGKRRGYDTPNGEGEGGGSSAEEGLGARGSARGRTSRSSRADSRRGGSRGDLDGRWTMRSRLTSSRAISRSSRSGSRKRISSASSKPDDLSTWPGLSPEEYVRTSFLGGVGGARGEEGREREQSGDAVARTTSMARGGPPASREGLEEQEESSSLGRGAVRSKEDQEKALLDATPTALYSSDRETQDGGSVDKKNKEDKVGRTDSSYGKKVFSSASMVGAPFPSSRLALFSSSPQSSQYSSCAQQPQQQQCSSSFSACAASPSSSSACSFSGSSSRFSSPSLSPSSSARSIVSSMTMGEEGRERFFRLSPDEEDPLSSSKQTLFVSTTEPTCQASPRSSSSRQASCPDAGAAESDTGSEGGKTSASIELSASCKAALPFVTRDEGDAGELLAPSSHDAGDRGEVFYDALSDGGMEEESSPGRLGAGEEEEKIRSTASPCPVIGLGRGKPPSISSRKNSFLPLLSSRGGVGTPNASSNRLFSTLSVFPQSGAQGSRSAGGGGAEGGGRGEAQETKKQDATISYSRPKSGASKEGREKTEGGDAEGSPSDPVGLFRRASVRMATGGRLSGIGAFFSSRGGITEEAQEEAETERKGDGVWENVKKMKRKEGGGQTGREQQHEEGTGGRLSIPARCSRGCGEDRRDSRRPAIVCKEAITHGAAPSQSVGEERDKGGSALTSPPGQARGGGGGSLESRDETCAKATRHDGGDKAKGSEKKDDEGVEDKKKGGKEDSPLKASSFTRRETVSMTLDLSRTQDFHVFLEALWDIRHEYIVDPDLFQVRKKEGSGQGGGRRRKAGDDPGGSSCMSEFCRSSHFASSSACRRRTL